MELVEHNQEAKKIGYETVDLSSGEKLKIQINDNKILDFRADKDYTVQISVVIIEQE